MEEKIFLPKIVCLFFPPLINIFGLQVDDGNKVFDYQKDPQVGRYIDQIAEEKKCSKLLLINYPQQEKQLNELQAKLKKFG